MSILGGIFDGVLRDLKLAGPQSPASDKMAAASADQIRAFNERRYGVNGLQAMTKEQVDRYVKLKHGVGPKRS